MRSRGCEVVHSGCNARDSATAAVCDHTGDIHDYAISTCALCRIGFGHRSVFYSPSPLTAVLLFALGSSAGFAKMPFPFCCWSPPASPSPPLLSHRYRTTCPSLTRRAHRSFLWRGLLQLLCPVRRCGWQWHRGRGRGACVCVLSL